MGTWSNSFKLGRKPALHCSLLLLPMLAFTAILLGLVYYYEWSRHHLPVSGLDLSTSFYTDMFYVDISATRLILVASWSSSTVLTLLGSFMTLVSFIAAADVIWTTDVGVHQLLPNSAQLSILVDLLDGRLPALLRWSSNLWSRRRPTNGSIWTLELTVIVQLFVLFISAAVIATDTWLHVSTKSVTMPFYRDASSVSSANLSTAYMFSRVMRDDCLQQSEPAIPCSVRQDGRDGGVSAANPFEIQKLWANAANSEDRLYTSSDDSGTYAYIGPPSTPSDPDPSGSSISLEPQFSASTLAMNTTCSFATGCNLRGESGLAFSFNCSDGFWRNRVASRFAMGPWFNRSTDFESLFEENTDKGITWGIFANVSRLLVDPSGPGCNLSTGDVGYLNCNTSRTEQYAAVLLRCESTAADAIFSWGNDTVSGSFDATPGNATLHNILIAPLLAGFMTDQMSSAALSGRVSLFGLSSKERVLESFAAVLSRVGLSFLGGNLQSSPPTILHLGDSMVVTEVPKAPLFVLVILNLWYAGFAVLLYLTIVFVLKRSQNPQDVLAVQKLLTVEGLVAAAVTGPKAKCKDNIRIGVVKEQNENEQAEWCLRVFEHGPENQEAQGLLESEEMERKLGPDANFDAGNAYSHR